MDTQQPSQTSQNEKPSETPELDQAHEELKEEGIEAEKLAVFIMSQNELVIGEVFDAEDYQASDSDKYGSIFGQGEFVAVRNPKRMVRLTAPAPNGGVNFHLVFADYDMIEEGVIELKPQGAFFLQWLDEMSQFRYCKSYYNWLQGKKIAKAEAAGLTIPRGSAPDILSGMKGRLTKG